MCDYGTGRNECDHGCGRGMARLDSDPWHPIKTMEEAMALYEENYEQSYKKPRGYKYAVCLKSDNIPVGYVHVSTDDSYDLGYGLRREFWHSGIMREAAEAVVKQTDGDGERIAPGAQALPDIGKQGEVYNG